MDERSTHTTEDASVTLVASFEAAGDGVRATLVVKFPPGARINPRKIITAHPDLASAHAWAKEQAMRRGIRWEPATPV